MRRRRSGTVIGAALALLGTAWCGGAPVVPEVEAKHIGTPGGVSFDEACTPSGPETCGNAIDDNCNGIIDEGCGLRAGKVQFEVAWSEPTAILDLTVSDPQGNKIDAAHTDTPAPSSLKRDRRCPADGCGDQNVDNVVFVGETPMPGQYTVEVRLVDPGRGHLPLKARFGWKIGSRVSGSAFHLDAVDDKKVFSFEL